MLADLLSAEACDARVKAFAKMKKSEKAATMERLFSDSTTQTLYALSPEQVARIGQWVPDCL
ncbi:MAG: ParB protein [uncultured bacterium]|nr:MAG: ParB protein [uncultured bacterium]